MSSMKNNVLYKKDDVVFREGDAASDFYMVVRGTFRVTKLQQHIECVKHERIKEGDIFGELSLFDKKRRACSVVADEDSEVIAIPYSYFLEQSSEIPEWTLALMKNMSDQIRRLIACAQNEN